MRRLLLLDFDGTIIQHDTLNSLVSLAIAASTSSSPGHSSSNTATSSNDTPATSRPNKDDLTSLWQTIVQEYIASHKSHTESYRPPAEERTTLQQELAFLESVGVVERASVARVGEAGFFRGLNGEVLERLGRGAVRLGLGLGYDGTGVVGREGEGNGEGNGDEDGARHGVAKGKRSGDVGVNSADEGSGGEKEGAVTLRKGFGEFLERQGQARWDLAVVSVNWSGEFIKGVVEAGCKPGQGERVKKVVANRIEFPDGRVQGPRELGGEPLCTAGDKLRAMRSLREGLGEERVVYFGDSTTDLACLVEADLGVIMADDAESKMLRTLKRVGFDVAHVRDAELGGKLVWARDFEDVMQSGVMERI